jgi:cytochrome c-type biogenesis protein CcmH
MDASPALFWLIAAGLTLFAGLTLIRAARTTGAPEDASADIRLYRDQLAEVDRDLARGIIEAADADRLRTDIARRILDADRAAARSAATATTGSRLPVTLAVVVALGAAAALYHRLGAPGYGDLPIADRIARADERAANRPAQAVSEPAARPLTTPPDPTEAALITRLRSEVANRPDDLQGHQLLAQNEAKLGNHRAAADAQARVIALEGDKATAMDHAILADLLVLSAEGYVSPEAEAELNAALAIDPSNGTARFYLGLMNAQIGRPDRAFYIWRDLLDSSPPEAPWVPVIRDRIGLLAQAAGVEYTPPEPARGPSAEDMTNAQDMSPEDRQAMIRTMVEGLADRLANQGGTGAEWAQLITALGVLGEKDRARDIWAEAQDVFAASPDDLTLVTDAARKAGVAE